MLSDFWVFLWHLKGQSITIMGKIGRTVRAEGVEKYRELSGVLNFGNPLKSPQDLLKILVPMLHLRPIILDSLAGDSSISFAWFCF